jgi:hypothetical protein
MAQPSSTIADEVACRPAVFEVGAHKVAVARLPTGWRWSLTVDGTRIDRTYESQVDAWEAGVREADRLDRAGAPG